MQAPLHLDQLRTFLFIVETGSFTKTAEAVFKTQSAVSMQIRRLEERIGKTLFHREGRALKLTRDGEKLLSYARRLLELHGETIAAFNDQEVHGQIRLGLPDIYALPVLSEILPEFSKNHPAIEINVACDTSSTLIDLIRRGALDFALIVQDANQGRAHILHHIELVWVSSNEFNQHLQPIIPLAFGQNSCIWRKFALDALMETEKKHRIVLSSCTQPLISMAVRSGMAVSVIPRDHVEPGMRILNTDDGFCNLPDYVLSMIRAQAPRNIALELFRQNVLDHFSTKPAMQIAADVQSVLTASSGK